MTEKRTTKTPATRAQERFDRNFRQLAKAREKAGREREAARLDVERFEKRRDYLAQDPDLPAAQGVDTYVEPGTPDRAGAE